MKNIFATYLQKGKAMLHRRTLGGGDVAPKRDWYILLTIITVFTLVGVGVGVYVYSMTMRAMQVVIEPAHDEGTMLDSKALERVLGAYRARTADFDTLRATPEFAPVPSEDATLILEPSAKATSTMPLSATSTEKAIDRPIRVES
ncbi:MAG: hypothetical protein KBD21_04935, partial [Candidatus Pacebacteria bacterium]|nr:hypothetical protein [Candidatus Paceibacterota bacterium]